MKGIGTKEFEDQKFKEEVGKFILEEQKGIDKLRDLLKQLEAGLISGKGLRSKLSLFRRSSRGRAQTLNHLIGMAVRLTLSNKEEILTKKGLRDPRRSSGDPAERTLASLPSHSNFYHGKGD